MTPIAEPEGETDLLCLQDRASTRCLEWGEQVRSGGHPSAWRTILRWRPP